ncbi:MAG: GAF domain-containing protein [Beijerinckiaceae bacterium]
MERARDILHTFAGGGASVDQVHAAVCLDIIENVGSTRASIWYFDDLGKILACAHLADRRNPSAGAGGILRRELFTAYFDAVTASPFVRADDAETNPATACFTRDYLRPNDIKAMLDHVIQINGEALAVLCCEECAAMREWSRHDHEYLGAMAALLKLSFQMQMVAQRRAQPAA